MLKKGIFISLEGVEGAGKSTQARLLADYISGLGYPVIQTHEPGGTPIAEQIRAIILNPQNTEMASLTELFLYLASRAQHVNELILPALSEGKIVVCDRFSEATIVYQGYARGIDINLLKQLNGIATDGLKPDITFVLDLDASIGFSRKAGSNLDRLERENSEFHNKVREGYLKIAEKEPERIKVINAQDSLENIHNQIRRYVELKLKCFLML